MTMTQRIVFRVNGRVQGVSYRYFAQKRAAECSVTGWVRNSSVGYVHGEAQGTQDALASFLGHLHKGPTHADVESVQEHHIDLVTGEKEFQVRA